jgi:Uma2 family endonuclease
MELREPDMSQDYTYADYLKWTIEERFELIKGKVFRMSPAPTATHQRVSQNVTARLYNFLQGHKCEVFSAPFDVRLTKRTKRDEEITTVVQPDICVVCDPMKIDERGCFGAPDIVVEILSPGNNKKELRNKYEVYEENGVKEYWIIHPLEKTFMKYVLDEHEKYQPTKLLTMGDIVTTDILPGFQLDLDEVFAERKIADSQA